MNKEADVHDIGSHLFPRKGFSGNGTHHLFTVEVRYDYPHAQAFGRLIIDRNWQTLPIECGFPGVPNDVFSRTAQSHGLLSWAAANALRWWAHAQFGLCLQSRIVAHEFKETYSDTVLGYHDVIGGGGSDEKTRLSSFPLSKPSTDPVPLHRPDSH